MSEPLTRLGAFFVAPAGAGSRARVRNASAVAPSLAVLGQGGQAAPIAGALAMLVARARRDPCAVVCLWRAGSGGAAAPALRLPARPAARRTVVRLRARGLEARASAALVQVDLADDSSPAVAEAGRAAAAAGVPLALALGGPRDEAVEELLGAQDLLVVVPGRGGDAMACLAAESLAGTRSPALTCEVEPGPLTGALALSGAGVPRALRLALAPAVAALA